jgi:xanthine dehydrogenase molybdopterin-binding subunit B
VQILEHVAAELGLDPAAVKAANFLPDVAAATCTTAQQQQQQQQQQEEDAEEQQAAATACATADIAGGSIADGGALATGVGRLCLGSITALSQHTQQQQQQQKYQAQQTAVKTILGRYISPETYTLPRVWAELLGGGQGAVSYAERLTGVQAHNREHAWSKRGIAVTPVR